jgi:hypothetical protein
MEPLQVADVLHRAARMHVHGRRRLRRQRQGKGFRERACGEEAADAEAPRGVGLQDIERPCGEQAADVGGL